GLKQPTEIAAKAVLVEFLVRLDVPQPARVWRNLVCDDDPHHLVFPEPATFHFEIHKSDTDAEEESGEKVVDTDGKRHDVIDLLRGRPTERGDVLFGAHRITERVVLVVKF